MILSSLVSYYDRLHEGGKVPDFGFSIEDIGFAVKIDRQGNLVGEPLDLRTKVNANYFEYKSSIVPYTNEVNARSSNAAKIANFIVDKVDYVFGMSGKSEKPTHHQSFNSLIEEVCPKTDDEGILAVKAFLEKWNPEDSVDFPLWKEMSGPNGKWVGFQLEGENRFIHERPAVKECWANYLAERVAKEHKNGISLVDGRPSPIQ
ncbi:MAG: type I-C CRISPR-associated protein Cas8c/Csd1, partial [Desulfobacteraceae bacterium]